jgi:hypothetical protein
MPFANKFRAMMDLPFPGDTIGGFTVEGVEVSDEEGGWRGYAYAVRMVLSGPGGKAGVRRALAPLVARRVTTFSSYGNPYQLWFGRPEIESLGDRRYAVRIEGAGARIDLAAELERFLTQIADDGRLVVERDAAGDVIETYLQDYRDGVAGRVNRYRRLLKRRDP